MSFKLKTKNERNTETENVANCVIEGVFDTTKEMKKAEQEIKSHFPFFLSSPQIDDRWDH